MSCSIRNPKRPLLRYFGGKWQLRHWIISHLPEHQYYAEPFAGAASVLLGKEPAPRGEIINDLNKDVINLFQVMQSDIAADQLMKRLEWTPYAKAELEISREATTDPIEKARRMIVRSFMGIEVAGVRGTASGFRMGNVDLSRVGEDGKSTFRNCARDWANWKNEVEVIRERLQKVMIYERDAIEFIGLMDHPDCLLYIDPPYDHVTRSKTRYAIEFEGHESLIDKILTCRSKVVISGYKSTQYERLEEAGWECIQKDYRANMSQRRRTECLWKSPNCTATES